MLLNFAGLAMMAVGMSNTQKNILKLFTLYLFLSFYLLKKKLQNARNFSAEVAAHELFKKRSSE